jgi:hypothetical protein
MVDANQKFPFPDWVLTLSILLLVAGVTFLFLTPNYVEFPMDDTYIHLIYAENLAETGKLFFSFPDEVGVGATSILWVLLLAAGHALGVSTYFLAKFLGVVSLAAAAVGLFLLLREHLGRPLSLFSVFLMVVVGNLAWFSLSGMETMLFVALGILSLLAYKQNRWGWVGISLGLMILTRPEGIVLAVALSIVELLQHRRLPRHLVYAGVITSLIAAPWFIYLYLRSGHYLPTSGVGKHLTHGFAVKYILDKNPIFPSFPYLPYLTYIGAWLAFLLGFTFGGMSLPAPKLPIVLAPSSGIPDFEISMWAPIAWVLISALLLLAFRRVVRVRQWLTWLSSNSRRPLIILVIWILLHNVLFMVYMPVPGTASRYGAINHVFIWIAVVYGLWELSNRKFLQLGLAGALAVIGLFNMFYWDSVYSANIEHMKAVRIQSAHYIRDYIPPGELCAASDIGAIRYHSERPIIDLGALVDPEVSQYFLNGNGDQYLIDKKASCLVIPGRSIRHREGWFDLIEIMGFDETELIVIEPIKNYEIDYDRWLLGYLPTNNYQASVNIYKVRLNGKSSSIQPSAGNLSISP